jgi:hypothetical protein
MKCRQPEMAQQTPRLPDQPNDGSGYGGPGGMNANLAEARSLGNLAILEKKGVRFISTASSARKEAWVPLTG